MLTYPARAVAAWLLVAASMVVLASCSSREAKPPTTATTGGESTSTGPVQIGISPGGVTTSLSAPASSTEEEYYQACHWAKLWMNDHPGDPHAQIEPYLAMVQGSQNGEDGTWRTPWSQLTPERQAAVIIAVQAAAEGGCD